MLHKHANIPIDHIRIYLEDCVNITDHIISVGSGNGVYEYEITKNNQKLKDKMILIDPNPESFEKYPTKDFLKINYNTVNDLILNKPEVINNCVLLLCWTPPTQYPFASNIDDTIGFDFKSVELLKPQSIICLYEIPKNRTHGCAGSIKMSELLLNPELFDYKNICTTEYFYYKKGIFGSIWPKITWLACKGSKVPQTKGCLKLQEEANKISSKVEENINDGCIIS